MPDVEDAHEILQETALDLWRKFDQYDPAFPFAAWACRFAFRRVLKYREQKARRVKYLSVESLTQVAAERSEKDGILEERWRALETCLQHLCEADRLVVEHRYSRQMSVAQIAAITGRNTSALYKALERIRRKLLRMRQSPRADGESLHDGRAVPGPPALPIALRLVRRVAR